MARANQRRALETAGMPLASTIDIDAYKPAEIDRRIEEAGVAKARLGVSRRSRWACSPVPSLSQPQV
jgi:hypothetical protein